MLYFNYRNGKTKVVSREIAIKRRMFYIKYSSYSTYLFVNLTNLI